MTAPRSPSWALSWPAEAERLARRIALLEVEATFLSCDPVRRARLRFEAQALTARLEALKRACLQAETAA